MFGFNTFNFIRLVKRPPQKGPPPKNHVDTFFDPASGKIKAIDSDGNPVSFFGAGGATSTSDLTTSNGSSAAATGKLGQYLEASISYASRVELVEDLIPQSIASVSLTPGDWDVEGMVTFVASSATIAARAAEINTEPDTQGVTPWTPFDDRAVTLTSEISSLTIPRRRYLVTSNTPVYLTAVASFSAGTVKVYGNITARRVC